MHTSLFTAGPGSLLGIVLAVGIVPAQAITLTAPDVIATPGQTVTIPILMDNTFGPIQGWSYSCNIQGPLVIANHGPGTTTLALRNGQGPQFWVAGHAPGMGFTAAAVISFFTPETIPVGLGYELHTCDVVVPPNAAPGTVYPIGFGSPQLATGGQPVATVFTVGGQSISPTVVTGSIVVGAPASGTSIIASDCWVPGMASLASLSDPVIGTTWTYQLQGLPAGATHGFYVAGVSLQPMWMGPFGSPCTLQVANDHVSFRMASGNNLPAYQLPIPSVPNLIGFEVYIQGMHDAAPTPPFSNFLGLPAAYYFSNTIRGQIGNF